MVHIYDYRGVCKILVVRMYIQENNKLFILNLEPVMCVLCGVSVPHMLDLIFELHRYIKYLLYIVPSFW